MLSAKEKTNRRRDRARFRLKQTMGTKPRLSVHRSNNNIYAQVIDDQKGATVAAASTVKMKAGHTVAAATEVGKLVAAAASKAGVKEVVFDRGSFRYHGRVKAVAEAAREAGLKF